MYKQSEIGERCSCDVGEILNDTGWKRYLVPKGYYGDLYQPAEYYVAEWCTLRCEKCDHTREDFIVWKWHGDGSGSPISGLGDEDRRQRRYRDIKAAIRSLMPE